MKTWTEKINLGGTKIRAETRYFILTEQMGFEALLKVGDLFRQWYFFRSFYQTQHKCNHQMCRTRMSQPSLFIMSVQVFLNIIVYFWTIKWAFLSNYSLFGKGWHHTPVHPFWFGLNAERRSADLLTIFMMIAHMFHLIKIRITWLRSGKTSYKSHKIYLLAFFSKDSAVINKKGRGDKHVRESLPWLLHRRLTKSKSVSAVAVCSMFVV